MPSNDVCLCAVQCGVQSGCVGYVLEQIANHDLLCAVGMTEVSMGAEGMAGSLLGSLLGTPGILNY